MKLQTVHKCDPASMTYRVDTFFLGDGAPEEHRVYRTASPTGGYQAPESLSRLSGKPRVLRRHTIKLSIQTDAAPGKKQQTC